MSFEDVSYLIVWWVGFFHLIIYALAGTVAVTLAMLAWIAKWTGIECDLIKAYLKIVKEKNQDDVH